MSEKFGSGVTHSPINRRSFLEVAGVAGVLPAVLPAFAAQSPAPSANNRINLGVIGMGWQGPDNTKAFLASDDCQVVAACDIDKNHLQNAIKMVNDTYGTEDCKGYHDYRELLARPDIDPGLIGEPALWLKIFPPGAGRER